MSHQHATHIEGFLFKRSPTGLKKWQKRWCVLSNHGIVYFTRRDDSRNTGLIPLPQIRQVRYLPSVKSGCAFDIQIPDRVYHFHAATKQEALNWISAINTARDGGNIQQDQNAVYQGFFSVGILRAHGLPEKNPYCELDVQTEAGKSLVIKSTQVINNTSDPQWQAWFELSTEPALKAVNWQSLVLVFRAMQAGAMRSKMGTFRVSMAEIPEGNQKDLWGPLRSGKQDKILQGHLSVAVSYQTANFIRQRQRFVFGRHIDLLPCTRVYGYEEPIPTILLVLGQALRTHGRPMVLLEDGRPRESSMASATPEDSDDPEEIRRCYGGLGTVGIFRIAPNHDEAEAVKAELNAGKYPSNGNGDVHCISHLIKTWFRELPSPLLSGGSGSAEASGGPGDKGAGTGAGSPSAAFNIGLISKLLDVTSEEEASEFVQRHLNPQQRSILEWLLDLGIEVASLERFNKMSLHAFAIVMGPNLISIPDGSAQQASLQTALMQQSPVRSGKAAAAGAGAGIHRSGSIPVAAAPRGSVEANTEEIASLVMRQAVNFLELAMNHRLRTFRSTERHGTPLDDAPDAELQALYNQLQRCERLGLLAPETYEEVKLRLLHSMVQMEALELERELSSFPAVSGKALAGSSSYSSLAPAGIDPKSSRSSSVAGPDDSDDPMASGGGDLAYVPEDGPLEATGGTVGGGHSGPVWRSAFDWEGARFYFDLQGGQVSFAQPSGYVEPAPPPVLLPGLVPGLEDGRPARDSVSMSAQSASSLGGEPAVACSASSASAVETAQPPSAAEEAALGGNETTGIHRLSPRHLRYPRTGSFDLGRVPGAEGYIPSSNAAFTPQAVAQFRARLAEQDAQAGASPQHQPAVAPAGIISPSATMQDLASSVPRAERVE